MRLIITLIIMFLASVAVHYFFMSPIMTYQFSHVKSSLGKAYMAIIMGLYMVVIELLMHDHHYGVFSAKYYLLSFVAIGFMIYLYRKQKYIHDKQYLEEMIEHHSMALLTSERILEKTNQYEVAKIAKNIIQTQKDEIREMEALLTHENMRS